MNKMTTGQRGEQGFTLIELLVVILIIGVLAAIALPAFLSQANKARDASSKSDARNMVSQLEACYRVVDGYATCQATLNSANTGLDVGPGPGQVQITSVSADGYQIVATSTSRTGGSNHWYSITKTVADPNAHDCSPRGEGGCPSDGDW